VIQVAQEAGTVIRAGSCGSCCTIVYVSLLSAPDVQLRVSCAAFVRSNTDDVCEAEDCDIQGWP